MASNEEYARLSEQIYNVLRNYGFGGLRKYQDSTDTTISIVEEFSQELLDKGK